MKPDIEGAVSGKCQYPGCTDKGEDHKYGTTTDKATIYCPTCANKPDVAHTTFWRDRDICQKAGCLKRATFGAQYPDKERCSKHKLKNDYKTDRHPCTVCRVNGARRISKGVYGPCDKCLQATRLPTGPALIPIDMPSLINVIKKYEAILDLRMLIWDLAGIQAVPKLDPDFINTLVELKYVTEYNQFPSKGWYDPVHARKIAWEINSMLPKIEWINVPKKRILISRSAHVDPSNKGYAEYRARQIINEKAPSIFPGYEIIHQKRAICNTFDPEKPFKPYIIDTLIRDKVTRKAYIVEVDEKQHKSYPDRATEEPLRRQRIFAWMKAKGYECRAIGWNPDSYLTATKVKVPSYFKQNVFKQEVLIMPLEFQNDLETAIVNMLDQEPDTWDLLRYDE